MTEIRFAYFNYEHGGRSDCDVHGNSYTGTRDFTGLVRVIGEDDHWPDVLAMGEGDRYDDNGYEGALEAAATLRDAGGPPYMPYIGSLPAGGGPFAPVWFIDPRKVAVRRWYDHRLGDFAARNRNVLVATLAGREDWFRLVAVHGDPLDPDARLAQARQLTWFARPGMPTLLAKGWNSVPSGPQWEPDDLDNPDIYSPLSLGSRIRWVDGRDWMSRYEPDTRALDYLIGYWNPDEGRRVGGVGFHDVAEMEGVTTGTFIGRASERFAPAFDRFLVSGEWRDRVVAGSYRVHSPTDPDRPDSDHLRVSVAVDV